MSVSQVREHGFGIAGTGVIAAVDAAAIATLPGARLAALAGDGFSGFVSLEPHLAMAGRYGGFSGPEAFRRAAQALKGILDDLAIAYT
jgi:hypothetical protein